MKGNLIAISLVGPTNHFEKLNFSDNRNSIFGSFIAIDNREKSRDSRSSSNNPVVSDNRRLDNRDLTVCCGYSKEPSQ